MRGVPGPGVTASLWRRTASAPAVDRAHSIQHGRAASSWAVGTWGSPSRGLWKISPSVPAPCPRARPCQGERAGPRLSRGPCRRAPSACRSPTSRPWVRRRRALLAPSPEALAGEAVQVGVRGLGLGEARVEDVLHGGVRRERRPVGGVARAPVVEHGALPRERVELHGGGERGGVRAVGPRRVADGDPNPRLLRASARGSRRRGRARCHVRPPPRARLRLRCRAAC